MATPSGCPQFILVSGAGATEYNGIYEKVSNTQYLLQSDNTKQLWYRQPPPFLPFIPDLWVFSPNPYGGVNAYTYQVPDKNNPPCPQSIPGLGDSNWAIYDLGSYPVPTSITVYNPVTLTNIDIRNAKYTTTTEAGSARFRRLLALGYV